MFVGCINLTQAPSLPANTLAKSCYHDMFNGCVGLTATPDLPATKLAYACYNSMFMYCLNIKDGPDILPATELEELCYERMFSNCAALAKAPELPATELANYCYFGMFDYCSSIVEAPRLPATELKDMCYANMFHGCSSLAQAPELPAMEVTFGCYSGMFSGCTSLTEAPVLPAINVAMHCYNGMFTGCTGLTQAPELTATRLVDGCYNYMFRDCSNLNYIKVGVMDLDEVEATDDWVKGITGNGIFEFPCGSKYNIHGDSSVPMNFRIKSSPIVIFQNPDGSVIHQDTVCNVIPECPIVPTFGEGKVFKGWDPEPTLVADPEKTYYYTAIYEDENASGKWLCFTAKDANATVSYHSIGCFVDMQYSDDEGRSWHSWEDDVKITLPQEGSKIYIKGDNPYSFSMSDQQYVIFNIDGRIAASGSVMSLIDGEGTTLEIPNAFCFCRLFYECTDLVQAPELPATKLTDCCYKTMFYGCKSLTKAPDLPATELTYECYRDMFGFCDNLKVTPKLSAAQLEEGCYRQMFRRCLSLEQAPELPAMEMKTSCYEYMFEGCSSLKEAPALPATKLSNSCYQAMFMNCENLTKAPELPADTMQDGCYFDMFSKCFSLQEAPALPALTLADNCYGSMFSHCENLTLAPQLPAMEMKRRCYSSMFTSCSALTEAPELPATELEESCYESMFSICKSLVRAPELPATELKASCYKSMFYRCDSLNYIKVGVSTLDNDFNATRGWVSQVNGPGEFIFPCGSKYDKHGVSEVPDSFRIISSPVVIFQNPDGSVIHQDTVMCNVIPECPIVPTAAEGMVFKGWDPEPFPATDPTETYYYTAMYGEEGNDTTAGNWLCFTAAEARATIVLDCSFNLSPTVEYSTNGREWQPLEPHTVQGLNQLTLEHVGDKVYVRGNNPNGFTFDKENPARFHIKGKVSASGSVMSLIDGVGTSTVIPNDYCFYSLFSACDLTKAPELPATTLTKNCYEMMFLGCESLTQAPELPATTMTDGCYMGMFAECHFLEEAPELPSLKLADSCYCGMFNYCTKLEKAPSLPAQTLATGCYSLMFGNCLMLTTAPELPATQLADGCYSFMFGYCDRLTQAPALPATQLADGCYSFMFTNCKQLVKTPDLPATSLAYQCYLYMFDRCENLTEASSLPATELAEECYLGMFIDCIRLQKAPKLPATEFKPGCYMHMFSNCASLDTIKVGVMSLDNDFDATLDWVDGVGSPGVFIFPCGSNYDKHGSSEVPDNFRIISSPVVIFQNPDGSVIYQDTVMCDVIPECPIVPTAAEGMVFKGWDPEPIPATDPTEIYYYTAMYEKEGGDTVPNNWLCFTAEVGGSTVWYENYEENNPDVRYSIDGGVTWQALDSMQKITLANQGDKVYIKGYNPDGFSHGDDAYTKFNMTGFVSASGSVMSLIDSVGATTVIPCSKCFSQLFAGNERLVKAPELPATTLTPGCYWYMFSECTKLEEAPELPATQLDTACYGGMFSGCASLTQAPELPATELKLACYGFMFNCCRSLIQAPELPATQLAGGCYLGMFNLCSKLQVAPELPATQMKNGCYMRMFSGCASLTQAPELPAAQLADSCYQGMFRSCTRLTLAPELPASQLAGKCYMSMFSNCTSLTQAPELPATQLASHCYDGMFEGCDNITQAPELNATNLVEGCYSHMFANCTALNYIKVGVMTLDNVFDATLDWVKEVDGPGVFIFPCGSTYDKHGNSEVPMNFEIGGYTYTIDSTIIAEGSYTRDGITYTESTSWTDSLQTAFGCDSVINYRLVIDGVIPAPVVHKDTAACDLFTFKDAVYTKDASWNDTLHTVDGDSIIVYHLTIHKSSMKDSTITAEGGFTREGTTYTENTSWTETLQTIHGCDSIINYHLEIKDITTIPAVFTEKDTAACDMLVFKEITYTQDTSWNDTLQAISGGDSIVTYHLTIHKSATTDSTITAEGSFTWKGNTYTESTSWSDTLQTIFGCDSVVNYRLVIDGVTPTPIVHKDTAACDMLVFKDISYTQDASWNDTLQTASGGDSIVAYHLTIHKSVVTEKSITAEGSYTWKDITFTEDASWSDTLQTAFGCDSIVIYHLEIQSIEHNPIVVDKDLSACDSFLFKDITYTQDASWNDTLQTTSGGDSIIVYHLTIHKSVTKDSSIIAEGSYTWKGTTYTQDASWIDTLQTVNGCDSIVNYSLIVNEEKGPLELTVEDELYLVLPGGSETISYELAGGEGSKYEVRHNGQTISSGDVTNDSTVSLTCPSSLEPGAYTATMEMCDDEGNCAEKEFTFNVMRPDDKQKSFYVKVWNDVVICRNGGGEFLTYQWYKERKKCEDASQQYFNDVTLLDGEYMVFVTDKSGKSYFIEPITYEPVEAAYAITAEPNVVKKSEEFTVKVTGVAPDDLRNARIVVYRADGVVEKILNEVKEESTMRLKSGEFVIVLTVSDGKNANCKVLVR